MGKVESIFKAEINRLAKKEVRAAFLPLRREVRQMRLKLSGLAKNLSSLNLLAQQFQAQESQKRHLEASPEEVKASRFSPARIVGLRKKLGLSQRELALLAGVSTGAVGLWEKGKFAPTSKKKSALVALRKLGKRDVKKLLAEKGGEEQKEAQPQKERRAKRKPRVRKANRAARQTRARKESNGKKPRARKARSARRKK